MKNNLLLLLIIFSAFTVQSQVSLVEEIYAGNVDNYSPNNLVDINGILYFTGDYENFLFRSDGTAEGTYQIKRIVCSNLGSTSESHVFNNEIYFYGRDFYLDIPSGDKTGTELWKTDGTEEGTVLVKDINVGSSSGAGNHICVTSQFIIFTADDGTSGDIIWKTDGTEAGTIPVKDIDPNKTYETLNNFFALNNIVYFAADDGINSKELWRTDGTTDGTYMLKDISVGNEWDGSYPEDFFAFNGELFFSADDEIHGRELWKTDGTENGTVLVKDLYTGEEDGYDFVNEISEYNGKFYFCGNSEDRGYEVWSSDGTKTGTTMLKDINYGSNNGFGSTVGAEFVELNGKLYFSADGGLWETDGTEAGTTLISTAGAGYKVQYNGKLYFQAQDTEHGAELWESDGTSAGTKIVADIYVGDQGSRPRNLTVSGNYLYFVPFEQTYGRELWKYYAEDLTTDMNNLSADEFSVTIYPNSNNGKFNVKITNTNNSELKLSLYNITGKQILQQNIQGEIINKEIDITNYSKGIYFLKVTGNNFTEVRKVIYN